VRDAKRLALGSVDVIILVFSSDNLQSLLDLNEWLELLDSFYDSEPDEPRPEYILVRNKVDVENQVDQDLIEALLEGNTRISNYFETSCLTGRGVDSLRLWFHTRFFEPKKEVPQVQVEKRQFLHGTNFNCMICGEAMAFDINDETTYLSKTSHEKFFGMQLTTYRVAHTKDTESHVNVVIVDHKGLFRGHKDAYVEAAIPETMVADHRFSVIDGGVESCKGHPFIDMILFFDRENYWVMEIICPETLKPAALTRMLHDRILESEAIYEVAPEYSTMTIADRQIHLWLKGKKGVAVQVSDPNVLTALGPLAREIIETKMNQGTSIRHSITLTLEIMKESPNLSSRVIKRLLTDDLLYSKTTTEYIDRIQRIIERISSEFPLAKEILEPLLKGETSLMELFENGYSNRVDEIFELVDYVNRRGLFG
jgi:hypothetical protein